jgi:hypothetical protein
MTKLFLNTANNITNIYIADSDKLPVLVSDTCILNLCKALAQNINTEYDVDEIEVSNDHKLNVKSSKYPVNKIWAYTGGEINFHNEYCGSIKTIILVDNDSTIKLTGSRVNIDKCGIGANSHFVFSVKEKEFVIYTSRFSEPVIIDNFSLIANLSYFLGKQDFDSHEFKLSLNHSHALKLFKELYRDNNAIMDVLLSPCHVRAKDVKIYINNHFFELNGIKKYDGTGLYGLPKWVMGIITSYLDFSDIISLPGIKSLSEDLGESISDENAIAGPRVIGHIDLEDTCTIF